MHNAQQLLYSWFAMCGNIRYERIKEKCDYLNIQLSLCLDKPISHIFYPLLYSGVVDFSHIGKYRITPPCTIINQQRNRSVISNPLHTESLSKTSFVGIYVRDGRVDEIQTEQSYRFSAKKILSNYPSVDKCVKSSMETYGINFSELSFTGNKSKGLAVRNGNGLLSYFADLSNRKCYTLTHPSENPDSINIATYYDRVINCISNGLYKQKKQILLLKRSGFPIMVYRVLLLETLLSGSEPSSCEKYFEFQNISKDIIKELNRIFCNTIDIKDE